MSPLHKVDIFGLKPINCLIINYPWLKPGATETN